jgi:hypothetical protein
MEPFTIRWVGTHTVTTAMDRWFIEGSLRQLEQVSHLFRSSSLKQHFLVSCH